VADAGPDRNAVTGLPGILNGSASFDPDGNTLALVQLGSPAQTVTLNGSASDDPDDFPNPTLTFQWTFVSTPMGSTLTNGDITDATTATASFLPDVPGVFLLQLAVLDGEGRTRGRYIDLQSSFMTLRKAQRFKRC
jgi:hypothetical protein